MTRWIFVVLLSTFCLFSSVTGDACGGLLEADGGELEFPLGSNVPAGSTCVWVIKLLSRSTVTFSLNRLSARSTLSVYPEHESTEVILNPIVLTSANVGETLTTPGQTLVLILITDASIPSIGFSGKWDSVSTVTSDLLTAANYVDTEEGRVLWNRFNNHERLTWSLNLQPGKLVSVKTATKFEECDLIDPCQCTYFALYEVTETGRLREVTRVCGRSSNFQTDDLYPQLLAFVYINSTMSLPGVDHVELQWHSGVDQVTTTTTTTTTTAKTTDESSQTETTPSPGEVTTSCGGVVNAGSTDTLIEYKLDGEYDNNEMCIWTIRTDQENTQISLFINAENFEGLDGLTIQEWNLVANTITETQVSNEPDQEFQFNAKVVFLQFSSDNSNTGPGFQVVIRTGNEGPAMPILYRFSAFNFNSVQGSFRHPEESDSVYLQNERMSAVFHPSAPMEMMNIFLNFLAIETSNNCQYDSLDIFIMRGRFGYQPAERLCGKGGAELFNLNTEFPILALFRSDSTAFDAGFGLGWRQGQ